MAKDTPLSVRIGRAVKSQLDAAAKNAGMTVASYVEKALLAHSNPPVWKLSAPELRHTDDGGTWVALPIAEGWPVALMPLSAAAHLAEELAQVLRRADRLADGPREKALKSADELRKMILNAIEGSAPCPDGMDVQVSATGGGRWAVSSVPPAGPHIAYADCAHLIASVGATLRAKYDLK